MGAKDQQYILNVNMALYIYTLPKKEQWIETTNILPFDHNQINS